MHVGMTPHIAASSGIQTRLRTISVNTALSLKMPCWCSMTRLRSRRPLGSVGVLVAQASRVNNERIVREEESEAGFWLFAHTNTGLVKLKDLTISASIITTLL